MRKLLAGASVLALMAFAGPVLADDVDPLKVDVTNDGIDLDDSDFNEDAISLNVNRQTFDNKVDIEDGDENDLVSEDGLYNGDMFFGDETFEEQKVNVNNANTGLNQGAQGGIALGIDINDKDGAISLNVLDQNGSNHVGDFQGDGPDDLVDDAEYDAEMWFGSKTFKEQKVNVNNMNTGINAGQQGGIAVAVSGDPTGLPINDNDDPETAEVQNLDVYTSGNGIHLELDSAESDAFAANVNRQKVVNEVEADDDGVDEGNDPGLYDANIHFGDETYEHQKVNVNNLNTGINAVQQGGIAVAVDLLDDDGAVAMNVLDQVAHNTFGSDLDSLVEGDYSEYAGEIHFGNRTFDNQKVNVNNINTGINAAQQGAIAVSVSARTISIN